MSAQKTIISTPKAPKAIGPYNQAVVTGDMIFVSGQLGLIPESGEFVSGGVAEQTRQVLENVRAILEHADFSLSDVVSCSVFLKDMNDFPAMNEVYAGFFANAAPSRATVEVSRLPKDGLVEISCIAVRTR